MLRSFRNYRALYGIARQIFDEETEINPVNHFRYFSDMKEDAEKRMRIKLQVETEC